MKIRLAVFCVLAFLCVSTLRADNDLRKKATPAMEVRQVVIGGSKTFTYTHKNFVLVKEFKLKVPDTYQHNLQLTQFREENKDNKHYDPMLVDEVFAPNVEQLVPGKTYVVRVFFLTGDGVTNETCKTFAKESKGISVGPEGLSLVWQHKKSAFLLETITFSLCKLDLVSQEGKLILLPSLCPITDTTWFFTILPTNFEASYSMLCFYEE
ncbi:MAG: hypothetical protein AAB920_02045 [Patescibacteria group bacterium]